MSIFDFGLQDYTIKVDNKHFKGDIFAVAGDTARRVTVQLLDTNGRARNASGLTLRLYGRVVGRVTYADGLLLDATRGIFSFDLANGMLLSPGKWEFQWQVIDGQGRKLHSVPFDLKIEKNISEGGTEATNFYFNVQELKQVTNEVKRIQTDLVNEAVDNAFIQANAAQRYEDLEAQYATELNAVSSQLAETATTSSVLSVAKKPRTIAHRGHCWVCPENTLPAYESAGKAGFWGAECDILPTSDGVWVLMHDDTVDRTTNGTGTVMSKTLAQIKGLRVDATHNIALYPNLTVPTLSEFLVTCKRYEMVPIIEVKNAGTAAHFPSLVATLKEHSLEENCMIISFDLPALQAVRNLSKKIPLQLLIHEITPTAINNAVSLRNSSIGTSQDTVTKEKVEQSHQAGLLVNVYTVNDYQKADELIKMGVDFISSDLLGRVI